MENVNEAVPTQENSNSVETETRETTLASDDTVAYDTYKRVLSEKKNRDAKLKAIEAELSEYKQRDLEAKGKYEELLTTLRDENRNLKTTIAERDKAYIMSKVEGAIVSAAQKANCLNTDSLLKLLDDDKVKSLEIDDKYNLNKQDVNHLIAEAAKEHHYLFDKPKASVVDATPVNAPYAKKGKALSEMTDAQLEEQYKQTYR